MMTEIERNICMYLSLGYLFVLFMGWRYIQQHCQELNVHSAGWVLLLGMNLAAAVIFIIKGTPQFLEGAQPSLKAFIIAVLIACFLLVNRVEILGNVIVDALLLSGSLVCIAAILPQGIYNLIHYPGNLNNLVINWTILSLAIAVITRVYMWLVQRR
jgi:hypothetical protein